MTNKKPSVYIDLDDTACNFNKQSILYRQRFPKVKFPQSQLGFFATMEPMEGFLEAWDTLIEHYDLRFLTRPSIYNLACYSEKALWVRDVVGRGDINILERLNLCPDKSRIGEEGDYLIDDWDIHGQKEFRGEFLHFGTGRPYPDWKAVTDYLMSKVGE